MGHYRSEMGYEPEDERRASDLENRLQRRTQKIQEMIDRKGLARVLAEIIENPLDMRIMT